jgi:two-component system sensor histidine kinase CpxA
MNSLFAKILVWFWATLAIAIFGSGLITAITMDPSERQPVFSRVTQFQLEEARHAYEEGGRAALEKFLERFQNVFEGRGLLTTADGTDVLTGQRRPELVAHARDRQSYHFTSRGRVVILRAAGDGKYWFFHFVPRHVIGSWFLTPQHIFMIGAAVLFCYLLAYHLTKPLRALEKTVARFGQGDFSARVRSTRSDEVGQLAHEFDDMAARIETLLDAERRLLLDISHELRSPLARLGVAVELARSGEDREQALNRIQKESDRLNELVGQLLQVTRAEGDPSLLRQVPVQMDDLVAELVHDTEIEADARGSKLRLEMGAPVTVTGDPELLRRAVENVIRNAIRYAPPDTTVEVTLGRDNGACVVSVRDYGPGVPEESLSRIFDPFYRVETDRNRKAGGVGLGLSIARRAVVLHRGELKARNMHPGLMVELKLPATASRVLVGQAFSPAQSNHSDH